LFLISKGYGMIEGYLTDPAKLREGSDRLSRLREPHCGQFRVYADTILEHLERGNYTEQELGATSLDVYDLAIAHAGEYAKTGYPPERAVYNDFKCRKEKAQGAHRPPAYATPTLIVDNVGSPIEAQAAA